MGLIRVVTKAREREEVWGGGGRHSREVGELDNIHTYISPFVLVPQENLIREESYNSDGRALTQIYAFICLNNKLQNAVFSLAAAIKTSKMLPQS